MSLKEKLKEIFRSKESAPFLFIGSGFSRRYLNLENWDSLLRKFSETIGENYQRIRAQANGDLPKTASLLANTYSKEWWGHSCKGDKDKAYEEHLTKSDSPLKIEIADYLSKKQPEHLAPELEEELKHLKGAKIDGIITTNWDSYLEQLFPEYTKYIGQADLISRRSHGIAEIYKIHGCHSLPNSLVLTDEDYEGFRKKNPYLSSKLTTIFIEHPIFFIGYSLTDPHIQDILEEIVQCFPEEKIDVLKNNLFFILWDSEQKEPAISETIFLKKLPLTLIKTNSFKEIFEALSETRRRIPASIFRKIKDELYELVLTDDPKGQLYVKSAENLEHDGNTKDFVVAYGAISSIKKAEQISKRGIIGLERNDIVRDVIFENGNYDPREIIFEAFPKILNGVAYTPIFKYLREANLINNDGSVNNADFCDTLNEKTNITPESLRAKGFEQRRAENTPEVRIGVSALYENHDFSVFLRMAPFIEPELINLDDLIEILKKHIDTELTAAQRSQFIKIVCLYDMIKNNGTKYLNQSR